MTKLELLKRCRDRVANSLWFYSQNAAMSSPKPEFRAEWHAAQAEVEMLDELISEMEADIASKEEAKEFPLRLELSGTAGVVGTIANVPAMSLQGDKRTDASTQNAFVVKVTAALDLQPMIKQVRTIQKAFYRLEDELVRMAGCLESPRDESA